MSRRPTVLVYRHDLLPSTETFVRDQALNLHRYRPCFVGARRVPGLELPGDSIAIARFGNVPRRLRDEPVALVHAHFEGGGMRALRLAGSLGVPLIVTCHGWDVMVDDRSRWPNPLLRRAGRARRRALQERGALFVAVSEHVKRQMLARRYPESRIAVHYIGVDTNRFTADPAVQRERLVLFVGRLVEKKGCAELLEAMRRIDSGARVVIVGDGPLRADLRALAARVCPEAELVGEQSHDAVREWMNRASVLCVPTRRAADGDMDGCALVLLEAQAMGLPVVAFASGGTPEAVRHGETGLLAPEGDVGGLAVAIATLLDEPDVWERLSTHARARARSEFDIRTTTAALESLYDRAVESHHAGPPTRARGSA